MDQQRQQIAVLTSGGDAPGMNAAVRAVVRTALAHGAEVYAIYEGYQGMVDGGDYIRNMRWEDVGGILYQGGTVIGTARSDDFRTRAGRLKAARNLVERAIDRIVVIGGDGSLTGANLFRQEWPDLLCELVQQGALDQAAADKHPALMIAGLVGSIDNDMYGTDMTIGADTALHRITAAVDAISSTAASHQRTFVVEVMGRHCGYLALMGALATGAEWVFFPEYPPDVEDWQTAMCDALKAGRAAGRRDNIVIIAEGARDRQGKEITSDQIKQVLEDRLGEDTRVTILGHVQRGGMPSAFDRNMSTILGYAAVIELLHADATTEPKVIGLRGNRVVHEPLMYCVEQTHSVAKAIAAQDYDRAMLLRGRSFREAFRTQRTLVRALPHPPNPDQRRLRIAVMHAGAPASGMNTAVRAAVRVGIDKGHVILGVRNGFVGLTNGDLHEMAWGMVNGWALRGGAELGSNRKIPRGAADYAAIAHTLEQWQIDALLVIGGLGGYQAVYNLWGQRNVYPALNIPIVCLPATIDNDLPGSELSVGADTALNNIMDAVDKIKQSAVAAQRCFIVEVMGGGCGYLALMSGLATGAERVYLPERGVSLRALQEDVSHLVEGFRQGKRLGLVIRNEKANPIYDTPFMAAVFEEEGGDLFDVKQAILGHLQQGGAPTPFDRIQATRLAVNSVEWLIEQADQATPSAAFIGLEAGQILFHALEELPGLIDFSAERPYDQWWTELLPVAEVLAQPSPTLRVSRSY